MQHLCVTSAAEPRVYTGAHPLNRGCPNPRSSSGCLSLEGQKDTRAGGGVKTSFSRKFLSHLQGCPRH